MVARTWLWKVYKFIKIKKGKLTPKRWILFLSIPLDFLDHKISYMHSFSHCIMEKLFLWFTKTSLDLWAYYSSQRMNVRPRSTLSVHDLLCFLMEIIYAWKISVDIGTQHDFQKKGGGIVPKQDQLHPRFHLSITIKWAPIKSDLRAHDVFGGSGGEVRCFKVAHI